MENEGSECVLTPLILKRQHESDSTLYCTETLWKIPTKKGRFPPDVPQISTSLLMYEQYLLCQRKKTWNVTSVRST